ncbi:hypothetical protein QBC46DRAFT_273641 [Diplogelasinospora grovesii]|uniref:HNH nuclease domain-containing protein n=1 Tax=Diplogelasinospora grovesii TaxID=303347 RepID=A0AAN6MZ18_9PEZI|nr:hypothetical protein QBC46DRAFT_273641 [Diplogelasinospora grovesii]
MEPQIRGQAPADPGVGPRKTQGVVPVSGLGLKLKLQSRRQPYDRATVSRNVFFLHPGYPDGHNFLLSFPAFDSGGVHHATAHVACAILADCRWDGYLSLTPDGPRLPESSLAHDDILIHDKYYFCLKYPVVPSFDNFKFPSSLPPSWLPDANCLPRIEPATSDKVPVRDETCRITCSSSPYEIAHIVPVKEAKWWRENAMFSHTPKPSDSMDTNCPENAMLMRKDIHYLWDTHKFAIVLKAGKWVLYVLENSTTDKLREKYHNLETQRLSKVARQFLFARFALAILNQQALFMKQGHACTLRVITDGMQKTMELSGDKVRSKFGPSNAKSGSRSPTKRPRSTTRDNDALDRDDTEPLLTKELDEDDELTRL